MHAAGVASAAPYPTIELHVHFEATVPAALLLSIARRNDVSLPAATAGELRRSFAYRDFEGFIATWIATTQVLRRRRDFHAVVSAYAARAKAFGCVYLEGIFSPAEPVRRGSSYQEVFEGYCDGAQEAQERHGVTVRLTPDITRGFSPDEAIAVARHAVAYRDRGVVGIGLGGREAAYPPHLYRRAFALARAGGLGSVPHAGETAGAASIRSALDTLGADRIRHGIRAVEDPGLVRDLVARGVVLDVCLYSNLRTGVVASLAAHPLPQLVQSGVACSLSTDDPVLFGTSLRREHAAARRLGLDPRGFYDAAVAGALCDQPTRQRLRAIGAGFAWPTL